MIESRSNLINYNLLPLLNCTVWKMKRIFSRKFDVLIICAELNNRNAKIIANTSNI